MKLRMCLISGVLVAGSWAGSATAQVFISGPVAETSREEEAGSAVPSSASSEGVEIISCSGSVLVRRSGSSGEEAAEEGMMLSSGDTVRTGAGSFAELGFDDEDQNVVRVEEGSTSVVLLKEDQKIELLEGEVFSVIRNLPPGRAFEVVTPTAVAGARGTEWVTRYSGEETEVEAYDDEPFVKVIDEKGETGEETRVKPGFATRVARFRPPTAPAQIPVARQQRWQNMRQAMQQRVQDIRARRGRPDRAAFVPKRPGKGPGQGNIRNMKDLRNIAERKNAKVEGVRKEVFKDKLPDAAGQVKKPQSAVQAAGRKPVAVNKVRERVQVSAGKGRAVPGNVLRGAGAGLKQRAIQ